MSSERETRYEEALREAYRAHLSPNYPPTGYGWANLSSAVMAVADAEVAAEVEAAVSVTRAELALTSEHKAEWREAAHHNKRQWVDAVIRAEAAESDLRALREAVEALADEWESQVRDIPKTGSGVDEGVRAATRSDAAALRRLLASSPAEGEDEPDGCQLNGCRPAPVSSGEADEDDQCECCWDGHDGDCNCPACARPAPVVTPSTEGGE